MSDTIDPPDDDDGQGGKPNNPFDPKKVRISGPIRTTGDMTINSGRDARNEGKDRPSGLSIKAEFDEPFAELWSSRRQRQLR